MIIASPTARYPISSHSYSTIVDPVASLILSCNSISYIGLSPVFSMTTRCTTISPDCTVPTILLVRLNARLG